MKSGIYDCQVVVCRNEALKLGLNEYVNYTTPENVDSLGPNYVYFGFIPAHLASNRDEQGIQVCLEWCEALP